MTRSAAGDPVLYRGDGKPTAAAGSPCSAVTGSAPAPGAASPGRLSGRRRRRSGCAPRPPAV